MNQDEFKKLDIIEKVNYINAELERGLSLTKICEDNIKISRSTIRKWFEKIGYKFSKEKNRYELVEEIDVAKGDDKQGDNMSQAQHVEVNDKKDDNVSQVHKIEVFKGNEELSLASDKKEKLFDMIENYDKIKALIEYHDKVMTSDDKSNLVINLPYTKSKDSRQTLRINPVIAEEFEEFCNKYESFTKKELLSQALKEFMEKYK